jgi:RNA polymerase sigma-70 factor (ECF subfamily)
MSRMDGMLVEEGAGLPPIRLAGSSDDGVDAFDRITPEYLNRAYRLAWAILGNDEDAADATQDALATAWQKRHSLRDHSKLEQWLGRILINTCRDRLRARGRNRMQPLESAPVPLVPDGSYATASRDEFERALESLSADHRLVVILRYWADLTIEEIADRLGVPVGTVKSRLHYSLRQLRSALEQAR